MKFDGIWAYDIAVYPYRSAQPYEPIWISDIDSVEYQKILSEFCKYTKKLYDTETHKFIVIDSYRPDNHITFKVERHGIPVAFIMFHDGSIAIGSSVIIRPW